jgi:ribonuclease HI
VAQVNNSTTTATSTINRDNQTLQERGDNSVVIHFDGAGARPDRKGSGFAWLQPRTGERHVEHVDGLTNNQAEYRSLISALNALANGSAAHFFTDSQLMWSQFTGNNRVRRPDLSELLSQVHTLIKEKNLTIDLQWVPRHKNLAGKLL